MVTDPQNQIVAGAKLHLDGISTTSDSDGQFHFTNIAPGTYKLLVEAPGFIPLTRDIAVLSNQLNQIDLRFLQLSSQKQSIVITAKTLEPTIDLRNSEVFDRTLFTRDDQIFQQLNAGINAGQHEGGGKSLEIRRFGFNLDHGGVNGGLKVMLDDVQQNQGTQGHGQGYLGALKSLSPELIRRRDHRQWSFQSPSTAISAGWAWSTFASGNPCRINSPRASKAATSIPVAVSSRAAPRPQNVDAYLAYEGSYTDGPFVSPLRYRRDNVNGNYTKSLDDTQKLGFRFIFGRNDFYSSGQIPLDLVDSRALWIVLAISIPPTAAA